MARVVVLILHTLAPAGAGPLTAAFDGIRRRAAERQAAGFRAAGAEDVRVVDEPADADGFAGRVRAIAGEAAVDGLVVLGSGSLPLATERDRRAFLDVASGPEGIALANNRYSADAIAIAGVRPLAALPRLAGDNGLPRWLAETAGYAVHDRRSARRLQVDLDSPLDALLAGADVAGLPTDAVRSALARVAAVTVDPSAELVVFGRSAARDLRWLERATASRTRFLAEERGFRTRRATERRPVASTLGLLVERDGPAALGEVLARLGDAALVDSRVLLAGRCGPDETGWPIAEDRFASDLLLPERIADPWLRELTLAARDAPIPIVLGGHTLVGPGIRLAIGRRAA